MLNIVELEKQFDEILNAFTAKDLKEWMAFAEERETLEILGKDESSTLDIHQIELIEGASINTIDSVTV